jgi:hypothetical protein
MNTSEIIQKIGKDILERSMKKNFQLLPQMGNSSHEFDYKYMKSSIPELKDYFLVVSKVLHYHNSSLSDFGKKVYVYDSEGNFAGDNSFLEKYPTLIKSLSPIE